ncbi:Miro domain protein [Calothrix brevissima NIES-22]|nr:Miro domain protein [Calothrix brevissima NIES-22]BAY66066.1 Miro domain protein [Calothrix brevissima NIES-22]
MKQESVLFSEVYNIEASEQDDWFNPRLDRDTHLCIDPFQVFKSKDPFFSNCRQKFMIFFRCAFDVASEIGEVPSEENKKSGNLPSKYKRLIYDTCKILKDKNIDIVRDSEELEYKDSLKNFMQRLGKGKCVVTVISDKYLKSKYCMFELTEFIENGNFQERIVPLVLEDAEIYDVVDIVKYIKFWEEQLEAADKAMKSVKLANLAPNIREDIDLYSKITRTISEFIGHLRDFLIPPIDIHENSNFEDVVNEINKILSR